jgi:hypothetical protein
LPRKVSRRPGKAPPPGPKASTDQKSATAPKKAYSFDDVARLVCKGKDPPEKLAEHFRRYGRPLDSLPLEYRNHPALKNRRQMSRREVVDSLKEIGGAVEVIVKGLTSDVAGFIFAEKFPYHDRVATIRLLMDLRNRCQESISTPPLASPKGGVKRGPGDVARPAGLSIHVIAASMILLAWKEIHRRPAGAINPHARAAAEALYQLITDPVDGAEPSQRPPKRGADSLASWRRHFRIAKSHNPMLGVSHDIYVQSARNALAPTKGDDAIRREPAKGGQ